MKLTKIQLLNTMAPQPVTYTAFKRIIGVSSNNVGPFITCESEDDAKDGKCTFTIVRAGDTFDPKKVGGLCGVTPAGLAVYGSCVVG